MGVVTISATELGSRLISGIPMLIALETNVPSTMFYTLDGSEPTALSQVYLSSIIMPTDSSTIRLRVYAISGDDRGYFDITYSTNSSNLSPYLRRIDDYGMGIVVDAYNISDVLIDGYGVDFYGNVITPLRTSDYELVDLDIKYSETGPNGEGIGTLLTMGIPPISQLEKASAVSWTASSPNDQNVFFNPKSLYITIDDRDGYQDQSIYPIIPRPLDMDHNHVLYLQGKEMYENSYISGGFVRSFCKDGKRVSYYFNTNECRWVKVISNYDPQTIPEEIGRRNITGGPLVFKWIYNKRSMI